MEDLHMINEPYFKYAIVWKYIIIKQLLKCMIIRI